ncbi:MAG: hypothetical protein HYX78_11285 [Armatimonadetes bacterium]|nr:hypothetical protein [Armatimonadota bacterium]
MKDFKQAIREGEIVFAPWIVSGSPIITEMMGFAGFEFVIIDTEHSSLCPYGSEMEGCARAAYAAGITPFVRTVWNYPDQVKKVLNTGMKGIIPPHINTREDAELLVRAARFAPDGRRSCAPVVRAARHSWTPWRDFWRASNEEIVVMPLVEEKEAIENIEDIVSVEGIDGVFLGPFDLAMTLGLEGDCEDPIIWDALKKCVTACRARGKVVGNLAWNMDSAKRSVELGAQFIGYSTDVTIIASTLRSLSEAARKEFAGVRV